MAKDAKPADNETEAPPKKSKKLLIVIVLALVLVISASTAAFLMMNQGHDEEHDEDEVAEAPVKKPAKKKNNALPPTFVNLDPFTVNLAQEAGDQYLQVALSLELDTPESQAEMILLMPRIRNNVTLLLSSKKASELQPKEGKEKLATEIMDEVNSAINPPTKNKRGEAIALDSPVVSVLFTSFIIQ